MFHPLQILSESLMNVRLFILFFFCMIKRERKIEREFTNNRQRSPAVPTQHIVSKYIRIKCNEYAIHSYKILINFPTTVPLNLSLKFEFLFFALNLRKKNYIRKLNII